MMIMDFCAMPIDKPKKKKKNTIEQAKIDIMNFATRQQEIKEKTVIRQGKEVIL